MSSSNKTGYLSLNKWLGSDKPKKDDFNTDNSVIDTAFRLLTGRVDSLEGHPANSGVHVTAEEKAKWNAPAGNMSTNVYLGDGTVSRSIPMGFRPKIGFLFAVGNGPFHADWSGQESKVYCGFFSSYGCSRNITVTATGIDVYHNVTKPIDGCSYKLNETNAVYVWVAWPN